MLKHVLVPLDGSPLAEKALDAARRILPPDGKVTLLICVQDAIPPAQADGSAEIAATLAVNAALHDSTAAQAKDYLEHQATNLKLHGLEADTEIGAGDIAD